jgi:hypothetical protein
VGYSVGVPGLLARRCATANTQARPGQVPGQVAGGLGDQHHHGQIVKELERADDAFGPLLAVRSGRLPQEKAQPAQRSRRVSGIRAHAPGWGLR